MQRPVPKSGNYIHARDLHEQGLCIQLTDVLSRASSRVTPVHRLNINHALPQIYAYWKEPCRYIYSNTLDIPVEYPSTKCMHAQYLGFSLDIHAYRLSPCKDPSHYILWNFNVSFSRSKFQMWIKIQTKFCMVIFRLYFKAHFRLNKVEIWPYKMLSSDFNLCLRFSRCMHLFGINRTTLDHMTIVIINLYHTNFLLFSIGFNVWLRTPIPS
jgi:hypothetical protein